MINNMTAPQKLIQFILKRTIENEARYDRVLEIDFSDPSQVEHDFWIGEYNDKKQDIQEEISECGVETGLDCEFSRYYDSEAVAAQMSDGTWVGWTYWTGGGKHGEPSSVPWIEDAYYVDCAEEEKMVVVRTFTKK